MHRSLPQILHHLAKSAPFVVVEEADEPALPHTPPAKPAPLAKEIPSTVSDDLDEQIAHLTQQVRVVKQARVRELTEELAMLISTSV